MGTESESPVDRQFKSKASYKVAYALGRLGGEEKAKKLATEWTRRDIINRISGARIDLARWLREKRGVEPESRTMDQLTGYTMKRREFFRLLAGAGVNVILFGGYVMAKKTLFDRLFNPAWRYDIDVDIGEKLGRAAPKEEVFKLYLLDPQEGVKTLCKDIAIAAQGINKDTYQEVDFTNFHSWGESELRRQIKNYIRFMDDLLSERGRKQIKAGIEKHGGTHKEVLKNRLQKLEGWMEDSDFKGDLTKEDLKTFLAAPESRGGLGYLDVEWRILDDIWVSWQSKNFDWQLKERINRYNQDQGTSWRIP